LRERETKKKGKEFKIRETLYPIKIGKEKERENGL